MKDLSCDAQGYCSFEGLADGHYSISVSIPGFLPQRYDVELIHGSQQHIAVQMQPAPARAPMEESGTVSVQWLGVSEKARKKFEKALERYERKDYDGAAKQLEEALGVDANFVHAYNLLGLTYEAIERPDRAREMFEAALRIDPKFLLSYLNLANLLLQQRDFGGAADVLAQAQKKHPWKAEPYYGMAKVQFAMGNLDRAEELSKQALERDSGQIPEIHLLLANIYLRRKEPTKLAAELETYLSKAPEGRYAKEARENLEKLKQAPEGSLLPDAPK